MHAAADARGVRALAGLRAHSSRRTRPRVLRLSLERVVVWRGDGDGGERRLDERHQRRRRLALRLAAARIQRH
eukprot:6204790-Pleurochrysis_carterae.AAC.1